jgi:hypothetical protein
VGEPFRARPPTYSSIRRVPIILPMIASTPVPKTAPAAV